METITDRNEALEAVEEDGFYFQYLSERLKDDEQIVLEAVKRWSHSLQYASERLKDCLLYTSPSPRDATLSRMPSSA